MRLKSFSGLVLVLSVIGSISGCGASVNQQADAAPAKSAANALPQSAPPETAAKAAAPLDEEVRIPATAAEAAEAIDLSKFPLLPRVEEITTRAVARLDYEARLETFDVRYEYEFQRRNLLERQWKELSDSQISAGYADGQFVRSGFHLHVSVQFHDEPGKVMVQLQNHSNVNVSKLPVPPGAKLLKVDYNIASFETSAGVEETREAVRKLLLEQDWKVLSSRGKTLILKQNAVELTATVVAHRASPGKTRIVYWTDQMSADLPVPDDADSIYCDIQDTQVSFITKAGPEAVVAYYKTALTPAQWKATTEKSAVENGAESVMIFRNPANDLLRLYMWESRRKKHTRVTLTHQSAAEVELADRKARNDRS